MKPMMTQVEAIQSLQQLPYLDATKALFTRRKHGCVTKGYWLSLRLFHPLNALHHLAAHLLALLSDQKSGLAARHVKGSI